MTSYCSPRRPNETQDEYRVRIRTARDAWRQQLLDDYYSRRESRLLSPNSNDASQADMPQMVMLVERDILIESGQATHEDFTRHSPLRDPTMCDWVLSGKTLSEVSSLGSWEQPEFPDEWLDDRWPDGKPLRRRRSEFPDERLDERLDDSWPEKKKPTGSPSPRSPTPPDIPEAGSSSLANKRKRGRDNEADEQQAEPRQPASKRTRTRRRTITEEDTTHNGRPSAMNKRKRGGEDDAYEKQAEPRQPASKRARTRRTTEEDTHNGRPSAMKRKRGSDDEEAAGQTSPDPAAAAAARRKRVKSDLEEKPAPVQPAGLASSSSSVAPVTRARRRQLSGRNAQLFQLGQRGQLSLQEEQAPEAAADRSKGRPASTTKTLLSVKASNTTTGTNHSSKAAVKTKARKTISTVTKPEGRSGRRAPARSRT